MKARKTDGAAGTLYTIGHSTRATRELVELLRAHGVEQVVRLEQLAARRPTAIMCAEALPWRCHRSLIADALTVARWRVLHIQSRQTAQPHKRTPFLRVRSGRLLYPAPRGSS